MLALIGKFGLGFIWDFLKTPMGRVILLVLAFGAWTWWNRYDAAYEARQEVRAEIEAEYDRQRAEATQLAAEARERADAADAELGRLQELRDELVSNLGADACDIPDDLRQRLRDIQ